MSLIELYISIISAITFIVFIIAKYQNFKLSMENERLKLLIINLNDLKVENEKLKLDISQYREKIVELDVLLKNSKDHLQSQIMIWHNAVEKQVISLASDISEKNSEKLKKETDNILSNISSNIIKSVNELENKLKSYELEQTKTSEILKNSVAFIANTTSDFMNAMKGRDIKMQGDFGEMFLERILEKAGFKEGIDYQRQISFDIENNLQRPDVIISLPDNIKILIDAKTSFNSYVKYINEESNESLDDFIKSVKTHIRTLKKKKYDKISGNLTNIFMFLPIDNAYYTILNKYDSVIDDAIKADITIVSPASLLMILNTIYPIIRTMKQHKEIDKIITTINYIHKEIFEFLISYEKLGKNLNICTKQYDEVKKRVEKIEKYSLNLVLIDDNNDLNKIEN